jgi:hypothetical protein
VNAGNVVGFVGRILIAAWTAGAKSLAPSSTGAKGVRTFLSDWRGGAARPPAS